MGNNYIEQKQKQTTKFQQNTFVLLPTRNAGNIFKLSTKQTKAAAG